MRTRLNRDHPRIEGALGLFLMLLGLVLFLVFFTSCAQMNNRRQAKIDRQHLEIVRRDIAAAVDIMEWKRLNRANYDPSIQAFIKQSARLAGPPAQPLDVTPFLTTNAPELKKALEQEFGPQNELFRDYQDIHLEQEEKGWNANIDHDRNFWAKVRRITGKFGGWILFLGALVGIFYFWPQLMLARSALKRVTIGIQRHFEKVPPDEGADLADELSRSMDRPHKQLVKKVKLEALEDGDIGTSETPTRDPAMKPPKTPEKTEI